MVEEQEYKSKSQVKRELQALRDLGRELVELPQRMLDKISLDDELRDAILEAKRYKREARRRQIQHIGVLMREVDAEFIKKSLQDLKKPHQREVQAFQEIETWRDSLLAGDMNTLAELGERFPDFDRQHVKQLLRNAKKEREHDKAPKSARALFRYLNGLSGEKNA